MDNNRYEETPKKDNPILKVLKMFVQYLKNLAYDFIQGFKYNNMKLPGILVAIPGLLIGFFIGFHAPVVNELEYSYFSDDSLGTFEIVKDTTEAAAHTFDFEYTIDGKKFEVTMKKTEKLDNVTDGAYKVYAGRYTPEVISGEYELDDFETLYVDFFSSSTANFVYKLDGKSADTTVVLTTAIADVEANTSTVDFSVRAEKAILPFDYSAICFFLLMLFGILNVFTAFSMMNKKNLGSVVAATVTTAGIVICGVLYISAIFIYFNSLSINGGPIVRQDTNPWVWDLNKIMALISISVSMLTSITGVVMGYIFFDRTYEKVDR